LGGHSNVRIVRDAIVCLRPDAESRGIEFDFQNYAGNEKSATVTLDKQLMDIAIFNILDNAVKYSHRNSKVSVLLTARATRWHLTVTDTGDWIRPEDYDKIFLPLVRKPTGQSQHSRPGTGLGLAVVKSIILAHGGTIAVNSEPLNPSHPERGAVTTFTVQIPTNPSRSVKQGRDK
jgi:signal transduction histidine kinase